MMSVRFDRNDWSDIGVDALRSVISTEEGVHVILDAASVSNLTKGDNIVFIKGNGRDLVEFSTAEAEDWRRDPANYLGSDDRTYHLYSATIRSLPVQVYVDSEIDVLLPNTCPQARYSEQRR